MLINSTRGSTFASIFFEGGPASAFAEHAKAAKQQINSDRIIFPCVI
jgi:hypothetical protein